MRLHLGAVGVADHRADVGLRLQPAAQAQPARVLGDALDELRRETLVDVDALGGGADLAGVEQRGPGHARHGDVEVGVLGDDEGVFATQLEVQLLHLVGGEARDLAAGLQAAGEGDDTHARIEHERLARLASVAGDDVDDAGRQVIEDVGEGQRRERRHLGGLDDDGVAGGERRGDLPGHQQDWIVPRHDRADDAIRLLEHEVELARLARRDDAPARVAPDLGVVAEARGGPAHLVAVLHQRLAALARQQLRQRLGLLGQLARHLVQHLGALSRPQRAPRREGGAGRAHRRVHVGGAPRRNALDDLLGRGIEHVERPARGCAVNWPLIHICVRIGLPSFADTLSAL